MASGCIGGGCELMVRSITQSQKRQFERMVNRAVEIHLLMDQMAISVSEQLGISVDEALSALNCCDTGQELLDRYGIKVTSGGRG